MNGNNLTQTVHDIIADSKAKAATAAKRTDDTDAARHGDAAKGVKTPPPPGSQTLTLVPYTIVKSLASLDNIYETRLFGWTLAKAQSVLKLYNKDLSEINIEHALDLTRVTIPVRLLLNPGDKNYSMAVKSFSLASKKIEYTKGDTVYHLNIIAFPELRKDGRRSLVSFVIHNELWHALLDFSKGYRLFSLDVFMRLQSKYSVIMYLLCTQQSQQKTYGIGTLRQLLGCDGLKAYDRGSNFFARVIDPARDELKTKAPWFFEYSASKEGRRHQITEVIITPVLNKNVVLGETETTRKADELRIGLDETVRRYLTDNFKMQAREIERIEAMLMKLGDLDRQMSVLGDIKTRVLAGRVKKPAGYLVRTLQNLNR